jgi:hypothetical protein
MAKTVYFYRLNIGLLAQKLSEKKAKRLCRICLN